MSLASNSYFFKVSGHKDHKDMSFFFFGGGGGRAVHQVCFAGLTSTTLKAPLWILNLILEDRLGSS